MTSEQITELRKLHDGCIAQDLSAVASEETVTVLVYRENAAFLIACNNSIRQLLDEREALLEALRGLDTDCEPTGPIGSHRDSEGNGGGSPEECPLCRARAALAKAESP